MIADIIDSAKGSTKHILTNIDVVIIWVEPSLINELDTIPIPTSIAAMEIFVAVTFCLSNFFMKHLRN